jgi:hypothetical protein
LRSVRGVRADAQKLADSRKLTNAGDRPSSLKGWTIANMEGQHFVKLRLAVFLPADDVTLVIS